MPTILLAALLHTAQFSSLLHAFEHDPGAPQGKICLACATVNHLASACVDSQVAADLEPGGFVYRPDAGHYAQSTSAVVVRQRGPPVPL